MKTNSQATGLRVASVIFGLVSLLHLVRVLIGTELYLGAYRVSATAGLVMAILSGCLAIWLSKLAGPAPAKAAGPGDI
jgi:hypothetical protein